MMCDSQIVLRVAIRRSCSSHLQLISLGAPKKWPRWNLDIKNACPQADGSDRVVYFLAQCEWDSKDDRHYRDWGHRRMVLSTPQSRFVGPSAGISRTPWDRRPEKASNLGRRHLIRAFISFFGNRPGELAPSPQISMVFWFLANPIFRYRYDAFRERGPAS